MVKTVAYKISYPNFVLDFEQELQLENFEHCSFWTDKNDLVVFLEADKGSLNLIKHINKLLNRNGLVEELKDQNWNQLWESSFKPISIDNELFIKADFHQTDKKYNYVIEINPKMAFGTGHHETTYLMSRLMLQNKIQFIDKNVFDFGCGTGILSILASFIGAQQILAIDNDPNAVESTLDNININKTVNVTCKLMNQPPTSNKFDIILANINLNTILNHLPILAHSLSNKGHLWCSGFFLNDLQQIEEEAKNFNLNLIIKETLNNWTCAIFENNL